MPSPGGSGSGSRSAAAASFRCSVCQERGSNSWLYSCKECGGFDAHLLCARKKLPSPTNMVQHGPNRPMQPHSIATTPFVNVPSPVFNNPYPLGTPTMSPIIRPMINEMINNLVTNTPQSPSQVSQLLDLLGPFGLGGGSGSSSSFGYLGFDPSVFSSVGQPFGLGGGSGSSSSFGYLGFDPSVFSTVNQPFGLGGGSSSSLSSGYLGFDPSIFPSVDPSVFAGFDPSLLSTLFSGLGLQALAQGDEFGLVLHTSEMPPFDDVDSFFDTTSLRRNHRRSFQVAEVGPSPGARASLQRSQTVNPTEVVTSASATRRRREDVNSGPRTMSRRRRLR
ncbi:BnaC04g49620D [Brassica napus]|uniref:BnaC04g49620D protein n=1 Tax=Brassica napus TaxID=3708 RepID=A0A078GDI4_BRANA|nr:BnaC04g49620D [Brassica napus]